MESLNGAPQENNEERLSLPIREQPNSSSDTVLEQALQLRHDVGRQMQKDAEQIQVLREQLAQTESSAVPPLYTKADLAAAIHGIQENLRSKGESVRLTEQQAVAVSDYLATEYIWLTEDNELRVGVDLENEKECAAWEAEHSYSLPRNESGIPKTLRVSPVTDLSLVIGYEAEQNRKTALNRQHRGEILSVGLLQPLEAWAPVALGISGFGMLATSPIVGASLLTYGAVHTAANVITTVLEEFGHLKNRNGGILNTIFSKNGRDYKFRSRLEFLKNGEELLSIVNRLKKTESFAALEELTSNLKRTLDRVHEASTRRQVRDGYEAEKSHLISQALHEAGLIFSDADMQMFAQEAAYLGAKARSNSEESEREAKEALKVFDDKLAQSEEFREQSTAAREEAEAQLNNTDT